MAEDRLARYRGKRNPAATPEPAAATPGPDAAGGRTATGAPRFVVQEHHASRLHWDLRLEHDGALASWAIPNGIPQTPRENRLAVHTEDHPLEYLGFSGEIPRGQYGAGTMRIWDAGTYDTHLWEQDKVEVTFHGERLTGRYGLFPTGRGAEAPGAGEDWMIHRMDPPADPGREAMPASITPMLATAGELPGEQSGWSYEVKWDGVRALAHCRPGRLRLESRNLNDITAAYPEVRGLSAQLGMCEALLDGEIVAFDDSDPPRPSFERLQRRMHVGSPSAIKRLMGTTPVVYAIFDLLFLDGRSLLGEPYDARRAALEGLGLGGPGWRVPAAHPGAGAELLAATAAQGLEGIVAKRRDSRYEPGRRTRAWVKIKHIGRQEVVIGGWLPGAGRRAERVGALLMGVHEGEGEGEGEGDARRLRYAGRVGTGFTERTLDDLSGRLQALKSAECPFDPRPKLPRSAVFVRPELVAEIAFAEWTAEGLMRAPSFKGLRDDKPASAVVREPRADAGRADPARPTVGRADSTGDGRAPPGSTPTSPSSPEALFETVSRRPDGALAVRVDGRELKLTNWEKVLFPETGFTKGDLIAYYARIAPAALPHLHDRPLTLKRYPNGVGEPYFYEKQAPAHRPSWVATTRVRGVDYTLCQDRATLVWLANLADVELHTSLSLAGGSERPTAVVFDLDPGPPAGLVECAEVALVLRGLFAQLGLESLVKVSGSKGMQVYLPLGTPATYPATKAFARRIAEALQTRLPERVVSRMSRTLRPERVLVDWSQNDAHKTTVAVYSVRGQARATVSAPVLWEEVRACHDDGDSSRLVFDTEATLERAAREGDLFAAMSSLNQTLPHA